jgi:hypothetical protein
MKVSDRMAILSFYTASFKSGKAQSVINQTLIDDVVKAVHEVFVRSYPNVDKGVILEFVKSRFEDITYEIAKSVGWIDETKFKAELEKQMKAE